MSATTEQIWIDRCFAREDEIKSMRAQLTLIRVVLGLSPIHDPVEAVRVLYEKGRDAFEKERGPFRDDANAWISVSREKTGEP